MRSLLGTSLSESSRSRHASTLAARLTGVSALVLAAVVVTSAGVAMADPPTVGPVFPAPGSGTWTSTGTPTGGEIGKAGGITWSYSGVDPSQFLQMVWGLGYPVSPSTYSFGLNTATLAYDAGASNLAGGSLVFDGSAAFPNLNGSTPTYPVRLAVTTLTGPSAFVTPASLSGLAVDPSAGGVLPVTGDFSVNLIIQVSTNGGATWVPANDYFSSTPHTGGTATSTNVQGDFWYTVGTPAVSFGQSPLAFGGHDLSTTTQLTEVVTNTGTAPLLVTQIDAGGDYSAPTDTCVGHSIAAGLTCSIDVDFTPSVGGADNGSIVLHDNAADSPQTLQVTGSGNQPAAVLTPSPVVFGSVALGSSANMTLSVSNPGLATLHLTNATLTGADPGDFSITGLSPSCSSHAVLPGASCMVQLTFTPAAEGTRSATFTLTDDATPPNQSVTLTGVGTEPRTTVTPSNLDFGSAPLGDSRGPQAVTIASTGDSTVQVNGYSIAGADPSDFSILGGSCPAVPFSLAPGSACTIGVFMAPTATGARSATVSVTDSTSVGVHHVLVGGSGSPSADTSVFIRPSSLAVRTGATITYHVIVKNSGPSASAGVIVTDALPSSESFVSSSGAVCSTPQPGFTGTIACSLGGMPSSSSQAFTFVVKVHAKKKATVTNKVQVRSSTHDSITDNNVAKVAVRVK